MKYQPIKPVGISALYCLKNMMYKNSSQSISEHRKQASEWTPNEQELTLITTPVVFHHLVLI